MLYLILAIVTSAMISILMRISGEKITGNTALLAMSYLTSTIIAAFYMKPESFVSVFVSEPSGLLTVAAMAVVNGCLYVGGFVLMQWNIPRNGVVLTSTYMRLGLIVCMALSVVLFREIPSPVQFVGFCLAVGAIILNGGKQRAESARFFPGLILILLSGGIGDTWIKVFNEFGVKQLSDPFLMFTFIVATLLCFGLMLYKKQRVGLWEALFGAAIAIPNYYNSRFLLKSLDTLPGIIVYPTFSVATLLLITVAGVCFFKERLSKRQWTAMGIILVALALLNL